MMVRSLVGLVAVSLMACVEPPTTETDVGTDPSTDVDTDTDTDVDRSCAPPLTAQVTAASVSGLTTVQASGGTGDYRFAVIDDGDINPLSGVFFAPPMPGTYGVRVTDEGCEGDATVDIDVVSRLALVPEQAFVLPLVSFQLDVVGGTGGATCAHVSGSGHVTASCVVTVGLPGTTIVRATDAETGDTAEAVIVAGEANALALSPSEQLVLPVGTAKSVRALTGSGFLGLSTDSDIVDVVGDQLVAVGEGTAVVTVTDLYTGDAVPLAVAVVAPLAVPEPVWSGEGSRVGRIALPGDVDGDGVEDVFFGDWEPNVGAVRGGAVLKFSVNAIDDVPMEVLQFGVWPDERVGIDVTLMDVTADGLEDLVVTAILPDEVANDTGRVRIYERGADGFATEPVWQAYGGSGDRLGSSVGSCDIDGDGFEDLIVGVERDEDRSQLVVAGDQGAIWVYKGSAEGLEDTASIQRFGKSFVDGEWQQRAGALMGARLSTGDVNGDGLCDVAVGAWNRRLSADGVSGGFVALYLGDASRGLTDDPVRLFENNVVANELGIDHRMADFDGDGLDELIISEPRFDPEGMRDVGAVHIYRSGGLDLDVDAGVPVQGGELADWRLVGMRNSDFLGDKIELVDVDADGQLDLMVGASFSEWGMPEQNNDSGNVVVFTAATLAADLDAGVTERVAADGDHIWWGPALPAAAGQSFAPVADFDDDGWPELIMRGGRGDTLGPEVGQYWMMSSTVMGSETALGFPGGPAGMRHGESLTAVSTPRGTEVVVGAFDAAIGTAVRAGRLVAYSASTGAIVWDPPQHPMQSGGDRLGWFVSAAGDVDGDGVQPDLIVAAAQEDRPSNDNAFNPPECTVPTASNPGAAYVYRRRASGGWEDEPSAVAFGRQAGRQVFRVAGGFDYNGDGFDDVVLGSTGVGDENRGGVRVHYGASLPDGLTILCDPIDFQATEPNARMGSAMIGLGDLDGDGCDELAIGAYQEDFEGTEFFLSNQGVVRVLFGMGETCETRGVLHLLSRESGAQGGFALASGDLDGDGLDDLAVGLRSIRPEVDSVGGVWVVPGSELVSRLDSSAFTPWTGAPFLPDPADVVPVPLIRASDAGLAVWGTVASGYGDALAIIPSASSDSGMALAVGAPFDDGDGLDSGSVAVYRWQDGLGLDKVPTTLVVSDGVTSRLGQSVSGDGGYLAFGAPFSDIPGPDNGAAYVVEMP